MRLKRESGASWIGGLATALFVMVVPSVAAAQTPAQKAAAQAMFDQAKDLMKAGDYATACKRLEESQRLDAGMGTQYRLAECYEKSGRLASAWSLYLEVAETARVAMLSDRETFARDRATALKPRIASITVTVPPSMAALAGVRVERDGVSMGPGQWNAPVPVDEGEHIFKVAAPGKLPWTIKVVISGTAKTLDVTIPPLADAPKDSIPAANTAEQQKRGLVPVVVLGGAAVAAAAVGGALLGISGGKASEARDQAAVLKGTRCVAPPGASTSAACTTLVDTARSADSLHNAGVGLLIGAGVVGVGAITYLLLPASGAKKASSARVRATPLVSSDGVALLVSGSF